MSELTVNILRDFLHSYHVLVVVPSIVFVIHHTSSLRIGLSKIPCWRLTMIPLQPLDIHRSNRVRVEIRIAIWISDNNTLCVGIYPRPRLYLDVDGPTFIEPFRHIWRVQRPLPEPAPRIDPSSRVGRICIQIITTHQSDRIVVDEPTYIRIIEPEHVVVKARTTVHATCRLSDRIVAVLRVAPEAVACLDQFAGGNVSVALRFKASTNRARTSTSKSVASLVNFPSMLQIEPH